MGYHWALEQPFTGHCDPVFNLTARPPKQDGFRKDIDRLNMKDITYIAAFPKSGITYLNFMLFHVLFDRPQDVRLIDSDYIFDVHESLPRVPPPGDIPRYVKSHYSYGPSIPLRERANRAVYLLRDPIDVMMSIWDFKHLTGDDNLLDASPADREALFQRFCQRWVTTGGLIYPWAGSWKDNVASWLDQKDLPLLVVRYERLKAQPLEELKRILSFFGHEATEQRIAAAIEAGKPDNMRKVESEEVSKGVAGVFYRPGLARGYAQGFRFVGRMHGGSSEKVLSPAGRQYANQIFGPVMERARALAG